VRVRTAPSTEKAHMKKATVVERRDKHMLVY
jgi:hypothetical protein